MLTLSPRRQSFNFELLNHTMRDTPKAFGLRQHTMLAMHDLDTGSGITVKQAARATGYTEECAKQGLEICVCEGLASKFGRRFKLSDKGAKIVAVGLAPWPPRL